MNRIAGLVPDVDWKRPEDVIEREIDPESGMLATPYCPRTKSEIFVEGTEPTSVCPLHAGSGGETFLPEVPIRDCAELTPPPMPGQQPQQPVNPQQQEKRERGIRRLLRAIFGGGH